MIWTTSMPKKDKELWNKSLIFKEKYNFEIIDA